MVHDKDIKYTPLAPVFAIIIIFKGAHELAKLGSRGESQKTQTKMEGG
jgi:hypothetical protein